jgi:hypothetical protein
MCPSCSQNLVEGAAFCTRCGARIKSESSVPTTVVASEVLPANVAMSAAASPLAVATATVPAPPVALATGNSPAPVPQVTVNVSAPAPSNTVVIMNQGDGSPGFLIRLVWFLCMGWWLSFFWISRAWVFNLTVIALPVGLMMINRVPKILTLHADKKQFTMTQQGGVTVIQQTSIAQLPMWIRAVYFVLIGWWASALFAYVAWGLSVLVLTLPVGLLMFNYLPQVTTLRKN